MALCKRSGAVNASLLRHIKIDYNEVTIEEPARGTLALARET